ncbi:hypothetical protein VULLAG_LOCUS14458 [Vulpes lagopus]
MSLVIPMNERKLRCFQHWTIFEYLLHHQETTLTRNEESPYMHRCPTVRQVQQSFLACSDEQNLTPALSSITVKLKITITSKEGDRNQG